ncbi:MAG TPA: NAD-dependent epimerase/dehydratase family protein [Acidimicrobiia bacterium]|nr:NAD-dependent epimerase/dehydratase family protein [Acidimicrobiia bacterium]
MRPGADAGTGTVADSAPRIGSGSGELTECDGEVDVEVLVTGGAGFIGSHVVDQLLADGHGVRVLDDLSTGRRRNVDPGADLLVGSVADEAEVADAVAGVEVVFHLAALGSVPRSVTDPLSTDLVNVHGTATVLTAARDLGVRRVVFSSSSSVYGGATELPTPETAPTRPRSPYGVSKLAGEWYVRVFAELFDLETVALRFFNVYGPRQLPDSEYAAVIPLFAAALLAGERPTVYGDGSQSRDFTYVSDIVAANLAAAQAGPEASAGVFNVAPGRTHTLLELLDALGAAIGVDPEPSFEPARAGDIRESQADAGSAAAVLGWQPVVSLRAGLEHYVDWLRGSGVI